MGASGSKYVVKYLLDQARLQTASDSSKQSSLRLPVFRKEEEWSQQIYFVIDDPSYQENEEELLQEVVESVSIYKCSLEARGERYLQTCLLIG